MSRFRPRYVILILSVVLILTGTATASVIQGGLGTVAVAEVDFRAADGSNIHSTLQRPTYATSSDPLPAVVVIHGVIQNKEWLMAFGIELARRGFVVLTIDANGHGNSDPGTGAGTAALEFLTTLDYVNASSIGIIGHSMGGGIAWTAIQGSTVTVNALIIVGSGVSTTANTTYPRNMLIAVGEFDSLSSYPTNRTGLQKSFGRTDIEAGVIYGSFGNGTARELFIARTNHLFETVNPQIVSESVEWMKDSLKGGVEDTHWLPKTDLIYTFWLVGGFLSLLGSLLSVFPLLAILIDLPAFACLKRTPNAENPASNKSYLIRGLAYGAIGLGSFFPLMLVGTLAERLIRPLQSYGLAVSTWILGGALIAALVLWRFPRSGVSLRSLISIDSGSEAPIRRLLRILLLALCVTVWLYVWTLLVDLGLALDIRCFLPGLNDLTPARALTAPLYFVVFFVYFLIDGVWLMGALRTRAKRTWGRTQLDWTLRAMFIKCIPYFAIVTLEYGIGLITGMPIIGGYAGFSLLFFYAFTPYFAVSAAVTVWGYHLTDRYYLGAAVNAMLFAWVLAAALPLPM
jgi:dienelactone hydrolase